MYSNTFLIIVKYLIIFNNKRLDDSSRLNVFTYGYQIRKNDINFFNDYIWYVGKINI